MSKIVRAVLKDPRSREIARLASALVVSLVIFALLPVL